VRGLTVPPALALKVGIVAKMPEGLDRKSECRSRPASSSRACAGTGRSCVRDRDGDREAERPGGDRPAFFRLAWHFAREAGEPAWDCRTCGDEPDATATAGSETKPEGNPPRARRRAPVVVSRRRGDNGVEVVKWDPGGAVFAPALERGVRDADLSIRHTARSGSRVHVSGVGDPDEVWELLDLYFTCRAMKAMPKAGGVLDQPLVVRRAFPVFEAEMQVEERAEQHHAEAWRRWRRRCSPRCSDGRGDEAIRSTSRRPCSHAIARRAQRPADHRSALR
jgi:hypothetical protein